MNIHAWNVSHQFHLFGYILVYKVVCLLGQYWVILSLLNIFMKHFYENSILSVPTSDHLACDNNIWKKLLFLDIFVSPEQRVSLKFFIFLIFFGVQSHKFFVKNILMRIFNSWFDFPLFSVDYGRVSIFRWSFTSYWYQHSCSCYHAIIPGALAWYFCHSSYPHSLFQLLQWTNSPWRMWRCSKTLSKILILKIFQWLTNCDLCSPHDNKITPTPLMLFRLCRKSVEEFNGVYYNSLIYMAPFLIGIFFGFCKYNYEGKIKINSFILFIGKVHWQIDYFLFDFRRVSNQFFFILHTFQVRVRAFFCWQFYYWIFFNSTTWAIGCKQLWPIFRTFLCLWSYCGAVSFQCQIMEVGWIRRNLKNPTRLVILYLSFQARVDQHLFKCLILRFTDLII